MSGSSRTCARTAPSPSRAPGLPRPQRSVPLGRPRTFARRRDHLRSLPRQSAADQSLRPRAPPRVRQHGDLLKRSRSLWLRNPVNLTDRQRERLDALLRHRLKTARAYRWMLKFDHVYELPADEAEHDLRTSRVRPGARWHDPLVSRLRARPTGASADLPAHGLAAAGEAGQRATAPWGRRRCGSAARIFAPPTFRHPIHDVAGETAGHGGGPIASQSTVCGMEMWDASSERA
jgi:Transposase